MKTTLTLLGMLILFSVGSLTAQISYGTRSDIFWHVYNNGDTQGDVWWMGDETIAENGSIGGYDEGVYLTLDTPIVQISGSNSTLSFKMRYLFEPPTPNGQWDGYDAFNVRISTNAGLTWSVISGTPAYSIASSYVFGNTWDEGINVPGYCGNSNGWVNASFNLSAYVGQNVKIRFAFASDDNDNTNTESFPNWFGVMIDDICIGNYTNYGNDDGQMTIPNPFTPHDMLIDGNYIWIGSETGLYRMNMTTYLCEKFSTDNSGISSNFITSIAQDSQGDIWIGTYGGGIGKYDGNNWVIYNVENSDIPGDISGGLHFDSLGRLWAIFYGGGIAVLENGDWTTYSTANSSIPTNLVTSLEIDNFGRIWVGTGAHFGMGVGVAVLDLTNNNWTLYNHANSELPDNNIETIKADDQNRMWIGTDEGGIAILDGTDWTIYNTTNSPLTSNRIHSIAFDLEGSAWLGMDGGVANLSGTNWTIYDQNNCSLLDTDCIYSICIDPQGRKWIGTWEGIVIFDGVNWVRPTISVVGVDDPQAVVLPGLNLSIFPNPFNPNTNISFILPKSSQTELSIYNIRGQCVRKLVNEQMTSGQHTVTWDGKDDNGKSLASGMYLCRISSEEMQETHKMLLMK